MQFSPELRDGVASGRITLSFRLWQRPQVKVGGQYVAGAVRIEIDSMEMVPFSSVTRADVRRSGERDLESLRARARARRTDRRRHAGVPHRVPRHFIGIDGAPSERRGLRRPRALDQVEIAVDEAVVSRPARRRGRQARPRRCRRALRSSGRVPLASACRHTCGGRRFALGALGPPRRRQAGPPGRWTSPGASGA